MSLDERGRDSARHLHRQVAAGTDTEYALSEVTGARPRAARARRVERLLVAAAIVGVIALVGTIAVQGTGGVGGREPDDYALIEEQLPAGPLDGKESMRLPVLPMPQSGLVDGQTIVVAARGFQPDESVGVVMCGSEADTESDGIDACQLTSGDPASGSFDMVTYGQANAEGVVRVEVRVRRYIDSPRTGRIDCASKPERCIVGVGAISDYDRSGGAYLLFDGSPEFDEPSLEVAPADGVAPGQSVIVVADGLVVGRTYLVQQCIGEACAIRGFGRVDPDGRLALGVPVFDSVRDDDREVPCADRCVLRVNGSGVRGASSAPLPDPVPIRFDPDAASVSAPTTTTTTAPPPTTTSTPVAPPGSVPPLGPPVSTPTTFSTDTPPTGSLPTTVDPGAVTTGVTTTSPDGPGTTTTVP